MTVHQLVELGTRILNVPKIFFVQKKKETNEIQIVYSRLILSEMSYETKESMDLNFKRIESWLHDYEWFVTIKGYIVNLSQVCMIEIVEPKGAVVLVLRSSDCELSMDFESRKDADSAWNALREYCNVKVR